MASIAGKRGSATTLAYNAANFGMVGMTQSMAREFGPHGINVNCVCPGPVDTSRMDHVRPDEAGMREHEMNCDALGGALTSWASFTRRRGTTVRIVVGENERRIVLTLTRLFHQVVLCRRPGAPTHDEVQRDYAAIFRPLLP